jgi:hypothetical protein
MDEVAKARVVECRHGSLKVVPSWSPRRMMVAMRGLMPCSRLARGKSRCRASARQAFADPRDCECGRRVILPISEARVMAGSVAWPNVVGDPRPDRWPCGLSFFRRSLLGLLAASNSNICDTRDWSSPTILAPSFRAHRVWCGAVLSGGLGDLVSDGQGVSWSGRGGCSPCGAFKASLPCVLDHV